MNSPANNDINYFNARDLENKKIAISESKHSSNKNKQQHINKSKQALCNDVSTPSYVRGYN